MAREMPAKDVDAILLVEDAAKRAHVIDPTAAVHRLTDRGLITPASGQSPPAYVRLTRAGARLVT
jgi:hypothetical protein